MLGEDYENTIIFFLPVQYNNKLVGEKVYAAGEAATGDATINYKMRIRRRRMSTNSIKEQINCTATICMKYNNFN